MSPADLLVPGPLHVLAALLVAAWLSRRRRLPAAAAWRATLAVWIAGAWMLATPALGNLGLRSLEDQTTAFKPATLARDERTLIIVLASGQMFRGDGTLEPMLDDRGWARLRGALGLWRAVGGRLVVVGGPGSQPHDSLAGAMQRALIEAGVPAAAVMPVGGSRNTREDLLAVARALGPPAGPRWLVTSALHMPRAWRAAEAIGLQARPFPCDHRQLREPSWRAWLPDNTPSTMWRDLLHESIGLVVYRVRGWIP